MGVKKALEFAEREGINVIQLRFKDKKPPAQWKVYQTKRSSNRERLTWFEGQSNIGFVCGSISDNLFSIDIDDPGFYNAFFKKDPANETTVVKTGRGYQVYFKSEEPVKTFNMEDDSGNVILTVKGEGGYVVGPGSVHPNGETYTFLSDKKLPRLSGDVKQYVIDRGKEIGLVQSNADGVDIIEILAGQPYGNRDNAAIYLATWLRIKQYDYQETINYLTEWNKKNDPPLSKHVLKQKVESAYRPSKPYGYYFLQNPYTFTLDGIESLINKCKCPKCDTPVTNMFTNVNFDELGNSMNGCETVDINNVLNFFDGNEATFLNIKSKEMVMGDKLRLPFNLIEDNIKVGYKWEKWDGNSWKRESAFFDGAKKAFYRKIHLVDQDKDVVYKFGSPQNDALLAAVAETLLDGKDPLEETFVLFVNKFGDEAINVRYSVFIDNGKEPEPKKGLGKKTLKKPADEKDDKLIKDLLEEAGYDANPDNIQSVKDNIEGKVTKKAVKEFIKSQE